MPAPTLKRATDTAVDPSGVKYGAPDIVEIVQVIEGDHPSNEKIQAANVENAVTTNTTQTITGAKTFADNMFKLADSDGAEVITIDVSSQTPGVNPTLDIPVLSSSASDNRMVLTGIAQTFTAAKTFNDNVLKIRNPANTFSYNLRSGAITGADKDLTLPVLTGNDTVMTTGTDQTISGAKTFQNDKLKFNDVGNNWVVSINAAPQTASRYISVPALTGDDVLVTQTRAVSTPDVRRIGGYFGGLYTVGATISNGILQGFLAGYSQATITGAGAATSYSMDTNGKYARLTSGAVSGNDAGFNVNTDAVTVNIIGVQGDNNPRFKCKFRTGNTAMSANTAVRVYVGFVSVTGALLTGDTPFATGVEHICLLLKAAGSNYLISHNDASGAAVEVDTGVARNTNFNTLELKTTDAGVNWTWDLNGTTGTLSANLPAATANIYPHMQVETSEAVSKVLDTSYWFMETIA